MAAGARRVRSLEGLRRAVSACRACPLWRDATQGVAGAGPAPARLMIVGEQPGDVEDRAGQPFVGPAGRLLDEAMIEAGIERDRVFVTNVVKHFKWIPRGKRRIHKTPAQREIAACLDWLRAEARIVAPEVIVCLGATAAKTLLGSRFKVTVDRGKPFPGELAKVVIATVHPSSLLRIEDASERRAAYARFVADLEAARRMLSD
jgi:uracil-DNA glycosylase